MVPTLKDLQRRVCLGSSWPIVIGVLFLIEALPRVIVSLTEWWRGSTVGLSAGLMICGFGFPVVEESMTFVLVGGAVFFGSLLSAGILYCQLRCHEAHPPRLDKGRLPGAAPGGCEHTEDAYAR
jgi:hypothetical protein